MNYARILKGRANEERQL